MSGNAHFRDTRRFYGSLLTFFFSLSFFQTAGFAKTAETVQDVPSAVSTVSKEELEKLPVKSTDLVRVIGARLPADQRFLREVPSNTSYLSKADLKETQSLIFQDAVKEMEGVTFFDAIGNGWDSSIGLRGFSGSSNINFLVDGVRVNEVDGSVMNFGLIPMDDIESIQIDRGSASPIYGSNAFAGVVNISTGTPSEKKIKVFGGLEWSSFQGIRFHKGFSGTLMDTVTPFAGKFKYYFKGGRMTREGWRENDESRLTSFNIKTEYELPENQGRFYANVKHYAAALSNPGELTFQQYKDEPRRSNKPWDGRDYRNTLIQIGADKKFWDDHITASIMNSWRPNLIHLTTTTSTFTDAPFNPDTDRVTVGSWDQNLIGQVKYEDYLHEHIFNETLFGMEFRDQNQYSLEQDAPNGDVFETSPRETERGAEAYNTGIFWRETLKFFDKVIPYFGMRHDFHWINTDDFLTPAQSISERWSKSSLSTGVTVNPVEYTDLFFNYSQGFRVPTISEISPFAGTLSQTLKPEESHSFDVGTRLRYKDLAAYKVSYFVIDLADEISFDSSAIGPAAPFGQNINIGRSRRYGIEQRIDLKPIQELKFYGSYTWMRAYVRETNTGGSPVDGRELGQIPENRFTFGSTAAPLARLGEPYDGFKLSLRGIFTGRQHPQSFESASQATLNATGGAGHFIKHYTLFDFMMSYEWREKMIYFKINNLFDEKYYTRAVNATSFGTAIYPAGTFTFVNPGSSREFVLGSRWEF